MNNANRRLTPILAAVLALPLAMAAGAAEQIYKPAAERTWAPTGIGPLQVSVAYGDMGKGPYGTFLKLPKRYVSVPHRHSADYHGVVVEGTIVNSAVGAAEEVRLTPGSYWFQSGNAHHVTKCVSDTDCIVFLSQPGAFDFIPAQEKQAGKTR